MAASTTLSCGLAEQLAEVALSHVTREYPNKLDHVLSGPADAQTPQALHAYHESEIKLWWPLIKAAGIKIE